MANVYIYSAQNKLLEQFIIEIFSTTTGIEVFEISLQRAILAGTCSTVANALPSNRSFCDCETLRGVRQVFVVDIRHDADSVRASSDTRRKKATKINGSQMEVLSATQLLTRIAHTKPISYS